jgi:hypothetical protein
VRDLSAGRVGLVAGFLPFVILAIVAALPLAAEAQTLEYPYFYKSPRSMGMGGAGVAIGGSFDSSLINPANLTDLPADNWEVNLLNLSIGYGENVMDFVDDMEVAIDVGDLNGDGQTDDDEMTAVNNVLKKYKGQNMYIDSSLFMSMARGGEAVSWGIGALGAFRMNMVPHEGFGTSGLLEVHGSADYGYIIGAAFNKTEYFHPGFSLKFINRDSIDHNFSGREIVEQEDDFDDYLTDEVVKDGTAFGFDAGFIYEMKEVSMSPALGLSVLNIGDLDFGEAGKVPMTLNAGVSAKREFPVVGNVLMGLDLVDITGEYEQDSDIIKRLRMGAEVIVVDNEWFGVAVRAGLYQGYGTFGADLRLAALSLSYNTYAEEIGAYAGQRADRRHIYGFAVRW